MIDREKVIKDLEEYRDREFVKEGITVFDNDPRYRKLIIGNALALLKEQEAVKPVLDKKTGCIWLCGNCGSYVGFEDNDPHDPNEYDKYCRECGRPVLWEGR